MEAKESDDKAIHHELNGTPSIARFDSTNDSELNKENQVMCQECDGCYDSIGDYEAIWHGARSFCSELCKELWLEDRQLELAEGD